MLAAELERLIAPRRSWWRAEPGGLRRWLLRDLERVRAKPSTLADPEVETSLRAGTGVLLSARAGTRRRSSTAAGPWPCSSRRWAPDTPA